MTIALHRRPGEPASAGIFRLANGSVGLAVRLDGTGKIVYGRMQGGLDLGRLWDDRFSGLPEPTGPVHVGQMMGGQ